MPEQDDKKIKRLENLKKPKVDDLVVSKYAATGYSLKVLRNVEEVLARLYNDLQQYKEYRDHPDYGKIVSAYRTASRQKEIWDKAKEKYKDNPEMLEHLDEFVAKPGKNKLTPHMTGAAMDFYLGRATETENIKFLKKSKVYDLFSRHAYHDYKLAPYSAEPWHWECGDACMENIEKILQAEQASAQVVQGKSMDSNTDRPKNPLPPELPTETVLYGDSKGGSGDFGLEEQVIMEMEKDDNRQKNILNFLIGGSILLTTYLVVKKKR